MTSTTSIEASIAAALRAVEGALLADASASALARASAFGRIVAAGIATEDDESLARTIPLSADDIHTAADRLETATALFLEEADRLHDEGSAERSAAWVEARTEAEQLRLGTERAAWPIDALELEVAIESADELVTPFLFRLVEVNELRNTILARIAGPFRPRFTFCSMASQVHPEAFARLADVAELVARFDEARSLFESSLAVEREIADRAWLAAERRKPHAAKVVSFADFLRRRGASAGLGEPLRVAAADVTHEMDLAATDEAEVSWAPPDTLIVDVLVALVEGSAPSVVFPDGKRIDGRADPRTVGRYRFTIDAQALNSEAPTIEIPTSEGGRTIELARDGEGS